MIRVGKNTSKWRSKRQTYVNSSKAQVFRSSNSDVQDPVPQPRKGGPRPETSEEHTGAGSDIGSLMADQTSEFPPLWARGTIKQSTRALLGARMHRSPKSRGVRQQYDRPSDRHPSLVRLTPTGKGTEGVALRNGRLSRPLRRRFRLEAVPPDAISSADRTATRPRETKVGSHVPT